MENVRVAAVVAPASCSDPAANLARTVEWTRRARQAGARVICFPEAGLSGYVLPPPAGQRLPGPLSRTLAALAIRERALILAGTVEAGGDGRRYMAHLCAHPDGRLGIYRKLHLPPPEEDYLTPGEHLGLFQCGALRIGLQLCYDAHFPELAARQAQLGADVLFVPHASPRGTPRSKLASWMRHLPARAFDNGMFVIACNQSGRNAQGLVFPGLAVALGPDGRPLASRLSGTAGLLLVDLPVRSLQRVRRHPMRYFAPRRRTDLTRLAPAPELPGLD